MPPQDHRKHRHSVKRRVGRSQGPCTGKAPKMEDEDSADEVVFVSRAGGKTKESLDRPALADTKSVVLADLQWDALPTHFLHQMVHKLCWRWLIG